MSFLVGRVTSKTLYWTRAPWPARRSEMVERRSSSAMS
jgi:hypothetical protein